MHQSNGVSDKGGRKRRWEIKVGDRGDLAVKSFHLCKFFHLWMSLHLWLSFGATGVHLCARGWLSRLGFPVRLNKAKRANCDLFYCRSS